MLPSPTLGTASSCFVPFANESSPLPGARSWPLTRFGAVTVQMLLTTVLHQSVPVLLTRFPSVLSNVLPVSVPLEAATKNTANAVAAIVSRRSRPTGRPRSRRGRIRSPPVRAAGSGPRRRRIWAPSAAVRPGWPIGYFFNRGECPILHLCRRHRFLLKPSVDCSRTCAGARREKGEGGPRLRRHSSRRRRRRGLSRIDLDAARPCRLLDGRRRGRRRGYGRGSAAPAEARATRRPAAWRLRLRDLPPAAGRV